MSSKVKLPIVAIVGRPNVGKSSLFNRLIGKRQAIVSDVPGTTRDPVQQLVSFQNKHWWLIDTAGMEAAEDELNQAVQSQIEEARNNADVIILVIDAETGATAEDKTAAKLALKTGKPVLLAVNKIDAARNQLPDSAVKLGVKNIVPVSAIHGDGKPELQTQIAELLPQKDYQEAQSIPTMALLGRPNVGKSSLFNQLLDQRRAVVSNVSGTTRDANQANWRHHNKDYRLIDTGGVRRAGKIRNLEYFSWLRTLRAINEADVCAVVLDATEPSVAMDQKIAGLVKEAGKGLVIVINKWDAVKEEDGAQAHLEQLLRHDFAFVAWAPYILTSATDSHNIERLKELFIKILSTRKGQIKTPELNNLVQKAQATHPPAGLKNFHPKINYATQTDIDPPQFSFFGKHTRYLHWSYKRYLERQLRDQFDFSGTPITLRFKDKDHETNSRTR